MRKIMLSMMLLVASVACNAQNLPYKLSEKQVIELMDNYHQIICKWDQVYENAIFVGYIKTIEIMPADTSVVCSIYFSSNVVKSKKQKLEIGYCSIDYEEVRFEIPTRGRPSLVSQTGHPWPQLEAALNKMLRKTKIH